MRRGYLPVITLVIVATIAFYAFKARVTSNEGPLRGRKQVQSAGEALIDEREPKALDIERLDLSRIGLLRERIIDWTFKDINSILVVKKGKVLVEEYFNGEDADTLHDIGQLVRVFGLAVALNSVMTQNHLCRYLLNSLKKFW